MKWPDGRIYEGEFEKGLSNGLGQMIYANQDVYKGQWLNSFKQG